MDLACPPEGRYFGGWSSSAGFLSLEVVEDGCLPVLDLFREDRTLSTVEGNVLATGWSSSSEESPRLALEVEVSFRFSVRMRPRSVKAPRHPPVGARSNPSLPGQG